MPSYWDRPVFSVGGVDFAWTDIAFAAMVRGEWSAFERRVAEGLACTARADAEDVSPSEDDVDEAATAYRYDRDLIAAADVNAWLERAGISAEDWTEYLRRDLLRQQWAGDLDDALDQYAPSARDIVESAVVEGICSGVFETFERTLAGRVAVVFATDEEQFRQAYGEDRQSASIEPEAERLAHTHAHWLAVSDGGDGEIRLSQCVRLELAFNAIADGLVANGRLGDIVNDNRLGWLRLEIDRLSFASEAAAREALMCVRVDKLSLYDVGALARSRVARAIVTLDDLEPDAQEMWLAAEPGAAVGPIPVDEHFDVALLVSRAAPSLSDPVIAERARTAVIDRVKQQALRDHVTRYNGVSAA